MSPSATGGSTPVLNIVDASKDLATAFTVPLNAISFSIADAGKMSVSPNHDRTLVMSSSDSKLGIVDNVKETLAGTFTLPGTSESFFIATDNTSAFVAVPSAPVTGQAPGVVEKLDTSSGSVTAKIAIPGAHYLVPNPNGNQILVFSDNVNTVTLITPSLIGTNSQPSSIPACSTTQIPVCTVNAAFDRPVGAIFDLNGATLYVLNCGPECGGTTAGITVVDTSAIPSGGPGIITATIPAPGATTALLQGKTLYVAGTQQSVGNLTVMNFTSGPANVNCSGQPANCQIYSITDGYHTQMEISNNGQLYIGARGCTGDCLSIFNPMTAAVLLPTDLGDVTGIAPVPNRNIVYVCQGGQFKVYDTTTNALKLYPPSVIPPIIPGLAMDVKIIDFQ